MNTRDSLQSAEENRAMFQYIADYYDSTNRILSAGLDAYWRNKAVDILDPSPNHSYLDIGCGTGDVSLRIIHKCSGAEVIGLDPSLPMLKHAIEKTVARNLQNRIRYIPGDVLTLPFPDNSFDGAITSFCIRNVTDRKRGLLEINRVLKSGAKFVILELTEPLGPIMKPAFRLYSRVVMPVVTKLLSSVSAYKYLAASMADFPKPNVFSDILSSTGFYQPKIKTLTGGIVTIYEAEKI